MHVKDFAQPRRTRVRSVGEGEVGYERVAPAAVEAGVEWLLVEQDEADGLGARGRARSLAALARCWVAA